LPRLAINSEVPAAFILKLFPRAINPVNTLNLLFYLVGMLGRDSGYAQECWVFYPKYRITSNNEIGRVTTPVFDEY